MWFELNIKKLAIWLLPTFLRKPRTIAYLQALFEPLQEIHLQFLVNRDGFPDSNLYRVHHNWQKCYLEKALNDKFDMETRKITMDEEGIYQANYIYPHAQQIRKSIYTNSETDQGKEPMYLHPTSDYSDKGIDFYVNLHEISADKYEIEALVDFYKLAGTRYLIINNGNE